MIDQRADFMKYRAVASSNMLAIATEIVARRTELKLSLTNVADASGINRVRLHHVEHARHLLTEDELVSLLDALDI
jgi:transcriptional regulator with XRE-family HTH domain